MTDTATPTDVLLAFVLDASGSMGDLTGSTIEGVNSFLAAQREGEGKALLSLTVFNTEFYVRYVATDLREVPPLGTAENPYVPAGSTALLDAVGTTIKGVDAWLLNNRDFTGKVICAIQTDGEENSSRTHSYDTINDLIAEKTKQGWEFAFFGTGGSAWTEGKKFVAIPQASQYTYDSNDLSNSAMYATASSAMTNTRSTGATLASAMVSDPAAEAQAKLSESETAPKK